MGKRRFASVETVRLDLSDGDWIEVKQELSYGERQKLMAAGFKRTGITDDTRSVEVDWSVLNIADMTLWLIDWSFLDDAGKPVTVNEASIRALSMETAVEINAALDAHKASAAKNAPTTDGSPDSTPK
jgi:hypothetical protein